MKTVKLKFGFRALTEHSLKHFFAYAVWKSAQDSLLIKYMYFDFILNFRCCFPNSEGTVKGLFPGPMLVLQPMFLPAILVIAYAHLGIVHCCLGENSSH